ncbi:hypothetical protein [Leadbettera azotonutricia]|uniref:Putative membrane protein n=1 Tax=Leadbettera azotonutricia (strain ATCC BAA-888 / DSM 13862 / ZAS-9) TaxID=545695 RepID=F5YB00_LEAAZ|nr:hypothetical protein [Leadbettera azotonutricia]AEF81467.1 putative membrane protein [Leadbettera azotonutricia ZAS-9]
MSPTDEGKPALVPALIGAAACLFFIRSGFLIFFFLVPLGFLAFRFSPKTAWAGFGMAAVANFVVALISIAAGKLPGLEAAWDILYFSVMCGFFTWIVAPLWVGGALSRVNGAMRMVIGSVLCTLVFVGILSRALADAAFYSAIKMQIEGITSFYKSGSPDVVQNALLDSLTPEFVVETMKALVLRGGGLVSCVFIFWISRQASIILARIFGSRYRGASFRSFHVHPNFIWVLSFSILVVLASSIFKWTAPEILVWNVLALCVILYFAQGLGILQHFLLTAPPLLRLLLPLAFIILVFSPGINAVLLGLIAILGIAENWAAFRQPKPKGPPPTPEA